MNQSILKDHLSYDPATGQFTRKVALCNRVKVGDIAGSKVVNGYSAIRLNGRLFKAHRLAWLYMTGAWPSEIDHINGVKSDNRFDNLRECSHKQNMENQRLKSSNKTGHRGVYWVPRESAYKAQVGHHGELFHLGTFVKLDDAVGAVRAFRSANFTHDKTGYSA